jgi:hypothetical protein
MMGFVPVMWIAWGGLVLLMLVLKIYIGRLSRDENDQLVLDDAFNNLKTEQAANIARISKVQPIGTATIWLAGAATLFVIGYYILDVIKQFN